MVFYLRPLLFYGEFVLCCKNKLSKLNKGSELYLQLGKKVNEKAFVVREIEITKSTACCYSTEGMT